MMGTPAMPLTTSSGPSPPTFIIANAETDIRIAQNSRELLMAQTWQYLPCWQNAARVYVVESMVVAQNVSAKRKKTTMITGASFWTERTFAIAGPAPASSAANTSTAPVSWE